jgi:hypothetical protein
MVPNYVKWQTHQQLPQDLRVPLYQKYGIISRWSLNTPCYVGNRQATCDVFVIMNEEKIETHSVTEVKLPFMQQAPVPGPIEFTLSEEPEDQHTAFPTGMLLPLDLEKLVKVLLTGNDTQLLSFDGLTEEELAELFPVTLNYDKEDQ